MDVSAYLAKLVQNRKEVGISGLGTFYKKKSPGRYDIETHSFIPPAFILQFKTEVTSQNELAEYISREKNISVEAASYFIGQFAEELQKQLELHKEALLPSIGKLILTEDVLSFKSEMDIASGFEFYGLPPLKDEELTPAAQTPPVQEIPAYKEESLQEENLPAEEELPAADIPIVVEQEEQAAEEESREKKTPAYLKVILGILILLIAFFVVYLLCPDVFSNLNEKFHQSGQKAVVASANPVPPIQPADTLAKPVPANPDSISKPETKLAADTVLRLPADTAMTYEVIGSSPYNLKEAHQFITNMKAVYGITAKIVSQKKGKKIKISIATFKTKKEADLKRQELSRKIGIKGLYTYQNTHKPE